MQAKFTDGSIFRHISVMTISGTAGLIALFLVDLVDTFFLSLLGEVAILAALGYSASILFFNVSLCIGLSIGCGAMVARLTGGGDRAATQRFVTHTFALIAAVAIVASGILLLCLTPLLQALGAEGAALEYARNYLYIILPSMPLLALAMACGGIMRAFGEARNAMLMPMAGAIVNAVLDPIFIFGLDWGMQGAALASVFARVAMLGFGLWVVVGQHRLLGTIDFKCCGADIRQFSAIALPAALTNLSTPIGVAFITAFMAKFGNDAVAGNAIVARVQQVAFAGLFALSGAIGPIAAQNWGAGQMDRVMQTFTKSLAFVVAYCAVMCLLLALAAPGLVTAFKAEGLTADLVRWFCYGFSLIFLFNGSTFVTNALFNNLGVARYATVINFSKATLGTIPFAWLGAALAGPFGIYAGVLIGAVLIAAWGNWVAWRHIKTLAPRN